MSSTRDDHHSASAWRGFPGGAARLPRISRPDDDTGDEPEVMYVESAFLNEARREVDEIAQQSGFDAYFSCASLFDADGEADGADGADGDGGPPLDDGAGSDRDADRGPYRLLGVDPSASWEEVAKAHRTLVAELHPDRYIDAEDDVREAAERRVRDVNEAYAEIRRERAPGRR